jgi:hypothetical protein
MCGQSPSGDISRSAIVLNQVTVHPPSRRHLHRFRVIADRAEFLHCRAAAIGDLHTDDAAADPDRLARSARLLYRTLLPKVSFTSFGLRC